MFSALPPLVGVGGGRDHRPHVAPHDGEAALPAAGLDPVSPEVAEGEEGGPAQDEQEPLLPLHPRLCCVTGSRPHPWVFFTPRSFHRRRNMIGVRSGNTRPSRVESRRRSTDWTGGTAHALRGGERGLDGNCVSVPGRGSQLSPSSERAASSLLSLSGRTESTDALSPLSPPSLALLAFPTPCC